MVAGQRGYVMKSDIDKNLMKPKMGLQVGFGCSTPNHVGVVCGQRNRQTDRNVLFYV